MSTTMASNRRSGVVRVEPESAAASRRSRRAPAAPRVGGQHAAAAGTSPRSCQSITSASASTTTSEPTRGSLEHGARRVAEAEPADHDVEIVARQLAQRRASHLHLGDGEHARHQELVVELDLVDVDVGRRGRAGGAGRCSPIGVGRQSSSSNRALTVTPASRDRRPALPLAVPRGGRSLCSRPCRTRTRGPRSCPRCWSASRRSRPSTRSPWPPTSSPRASARATSTSSSPTTAGGASSGSVARRARRAVPTGRTGGRTAPRTPSPSP